MYWKLIKYFIGTAMNLLVLSAGHVHGQWSQISGRVTDAHTGEPIPFASVSIPHTTLGAITDFEGRYTLKVNIRVDSLKAQVIGYHFKIKKHDGPRQDFQLVPSSYDLGMVEIFSGENPAYRIVREAMRHRQQYNPENLSAYSHKSFTNIDVSIDRINNRFRLSKLMLPFSTVFDTLKLMAGEEGMAVLPFFSSEVISEYYFRKTPVMSKEVVKAVKMSGLLLDDNEMIKSFLGVSFQRFNFYNNYIQVLDRSFITPVASGAMLFYDYYIIDTVSIDGHYCYELKIKPLNKQDLAFNGRIWICDTTFALKRIAVEVGTKSNLNWVERYKIDQSYMPVGDSIWVPSKTRILIDMVEITKKSIGMIGVFDIFNCDFKINKPAPVNFFDKKMVFEEVGVEEDLSFWEKERRKFHTDTMKNAAIYSVLDTIKAHKNMITFRKVFNTFFDGYYRADGIELGMWSSLFGYNRDEGLRIQLNVRTNELLSRRFMLTTFWAYGLEDKQFKYKLQAEVFLNRKNWTKAGLLYKKDIEKIGITDEYAEEQGFLDVFYALGTQFADLRKNGLGETYKLWLESDLPFGFNQKVMFSIHSFIPKLNKDFTFAWIDGDVVRQRYDMTELCFITRFSAKETRTVKGNLRVGVGATGSNVYTFIYAAGLKNVFGGDFSYHKLSFEVERRWKLGLAGKLFYLVKATKIFGRIPYTCSVIPAGNESWLAFERSFNMMKYFEFVADQSLEIICAHHFEGFFLNRVPLLNKLKLREFAGVNAVWGSFSSSNLELIPDTRDENGNYIYRTFKPLRANNPYVEVYYGIENILKFLRVQFIHRLTCLDKGSKPFGVRAGIFIIF